MFKELLLLLFLFIVYNIFITYIINNQNKLDDNDVKNINTKRIALCISGQIRDNFKTCLESWEKYINYKNVDIFALVNYTDIDNYNKFKNDIKKSNFNIIKIDSDNTKYIETNKKCNLSKNSILMFKKIYKCNQLKIQYENLNTFKYDVVIRIRPDILLRTHIPINISLKNQTSLLIPKYYGSNIFSTYFDFNNVFACGICDQISFGSSKVMDIYSDVYLYLQNIKLNCRGPEIYLKKYLQGKVSIINFKLDWDIYKYSNVNLLSDPLKYFGSIKDFYTKIKLYNHYDCIT